ncbi:hypothetical protein [Xenorhabdus bovienii]|uniref:hypothetical protein n=1 Tax=Xenorhabdus bovienii TaxID=40576 RepID=UPI003DA3B1A6
MLLSDRRIILNRFFSGSRDNDNKYYHVLTSDRFMSLVAGTRVNPYYAIAALSIYNTLSLDSLVPQLVKMINNAYAIEEEKSTSGRCKGYTPHLTTGIFGTVAVVGTGTGGALGSFGCLVGAAYGFGVGALGGLGTIASCSINTYNHRISIKNKEHRDHKLSQLDAFINSFIDEIKRGDDYSGEFLEGRKKYPLVALKSAKTRRYYRYYIPYNREERNLAFDRSDVYRDILIKCIPETIINDYCRRCPGQPIVNQPTQRLRPV